MHVGPKARASAHSTDVVGVGRVEWELHRVRGMNIISGPRADCIRVDIEACVVKVDDLANSVVLRHY